MPPVSPGCEASPRRHGARVPTRTISGWRVNRPLTGAMVFNGQNPGILISSACRRNSLSVRWLL